MGLARVIVLLAALATPASAQLAPLAPDQPTARLAVPDLDENAPPAAFLQAARGAIAAGRLGEAVEALERAESRALVRSVRPSMAGTPSRQTMVARIAEARAALAADDRMRALSLIEQALNDDAQEPD